MSKNNAYKAAIELIASGDVDWKVICVRIAQSNPTIFVRHAMTDRAAMESECARLVKSGLTVQAIRLYRNETGASLKDAKEAVEAMVA